MSNLTQNIYQSDSQFKPVRTPDKSPSNHHYSLLRPTTLQLNLTSKARPTQKNRLLLPYKRELQNHQTHRYNRYSNSPIKQLTDKSLNALSFNYGIHPYFNFSYVDSLLSRKKQVRGLIEENMGGKCDQVKNVKKGKSVRVFARRMSLGYQTQSINPEINLQTDGIRIKPQENKRKAHKTNHPKQQMTRIQRSCCHTSNDKRSVLHVNKHQAQRKDSSELHTSCKTSPTLRNYLPTRRPNTTKLDSNRNRQVEYTIKGKDLNKQVNNNLNRSKQSGFSYEVLEPW